MRGKFFLVDKHSKFVNGQILFRYIPISKEKQTETKKTNSLDETELFPKYPIYLVIKPFAIDFFFHRPDKKQNECDILTDQHTCIIHLPLSLNLAVEDNLSKILNDIYFGSEKIPEGYSFNNVGFNNAYWDTFDFPKHFNEKLSDKKSNLIYFRKLLLDFIYDLEHSSVFEASPYYEDIEVHLKENFVFSAISSKAAYYYNRQFYHKGNIHRNTESILVQKLAESEIQWLNIIRDNRAVESFRYQKWFSIVEDEYSNVLFSKEFPRTYWRSQLIDSSDEEYSEENKIILRESARWYLRRYSFTKGMKAIFQFYSRRKYLVFLLSIITFFIIPLIFYHNNNIPDNINDKVIASVLYLFLGIIPFVVVASFLLYRMFLPLLSALLPRLLMAITSSWLFFSTTEELVKSSFDVQILDASKIWVFLLIIPVFAFMAVEINNMAPDINAKTLIKRMLTLIGIGFSYSLLIGLFFTNSLTETMLVRSNYLTEFYSSEVDSSEVHISKGLYMKTDSSASRSHVKYSELPYFLTNHDSRDKDKYQYLNFVKYNISWLSSEPFRLRYEVPVFKEIPSFEIFPGMLIYRAIFALFIGIFIQLIFEDKPITEPL